MAPSVKVANKVTLISIDGWGLTDKTKGNAIYAAKKPVMDQFIKDGEDQSKKGQLYCKIDASGLSVGLPKGNMGNSEVGHLTMGAGRVQYQDLVRINQSIEDNTFADNEVLRAAFAHAKEHSNGRLHLLGLVSDGGVHSHINHVFAFLEAAKQEQVPHVYIHFFADGRDTPPDSGTKYIKQLQEFLSKLGHGKIATLVGRYYAMDRDKRWDRIEIAYNMLVAGEGEETSADNLVKTVEQRYAKKEQDEFLKPIVVDKEGLVKDNDTLIFFDYRSDRMREIVETMAVRRNFKAKHEIPKNLKLYQMTQYDIKFKSEYGLDIIYPPVDMKNVIAEWISSKGLKQYHTAETEKYAHVTFFFNGGREQAFENEDRKLVQSPKVPTYDKEPAMSQHAVGDSVIEAMSKGDEYPFVMCNLAAPDMVGHTGMYEPAVIACTVCDEVIGKVYEACQKYGYTLVVTADHGNAEEMEDEEGNPKTSHTTNLIPFIVASGSDLQFEDYVKDAEQKGKPSGGLSNVAPTILTIMGLDVPKEMTAKSLVKKVA